MQTKKIVLSFFIGLTSSLALPSNATTPVRSSFKYEGQLRENMAQLLGVQEKEIKLTSSKRTTFQDCLPTPGSRNTTCKPLPRNGWRVTMSGKGENWNYYVTDEGSITLDARTSLNKAVRSTLARELAIEPNQLQIIAAQAINTITPCPRNTKNCQPKTTLEWRVLATGRETPFQLQLNGKPSNLFKVSAGFIPTNTAKMPRELAIKVMEDVVSRDGLLTANLRVESIKATTWNFCRGKGPGPTPPDMGACFDVDQPGWQMIVVSGGNRYFYYIPEAKPINPIGGSTIAVISPDGMQSLPKLAIETVQKDAARRANIPANMMRVKFAEPKFFDGCLNLDKQKISCGNSILAGWQVTALGGKAPGSSPPISNATWAYNVNLTGNDARFVNSSVWFPKP